MKLSEYIKKYHFDPDVNFIEWNGLFGFTLKKSKSMKSISRKDDLVVLHSKTNDSDSSTPYITSVYFNEILQLYQTYRILTLNVDSQRIDSQYNAIRNKFKDFGFTDKELEAFELSRCVYQDSDGLHYIFNYFEEDEFGHFRLHYLREIPKDEADYNYIMYGLEEPMRECITTEYGLVNEVFNKIIIPELCMMATYEAFMSWLITKKETFSPYREILRDIMLDLYTNNDAIVGRFFLNIPNKSTLVHFINTYFFGKLFLKYSAWGSRFTNGENFSFTVESIITTLEKRLKSISKSHSLMYKRIFDKIAEEIHKVVIPPCSSFEQCGAIVKPNTDPIFSPNSKHTIHANSFITITLTEFSKQCYLQAYGDYPD